MKQKLWSNIVGRWGQHFLVITSFLTISYGLRWGTIPDHSLNTILRDLLDNTSEDRKFGVYYLNSGDADGRGGAVPQRIDHVKIRTREGNAEDRCQIVVLPFSIWWR